MTDWLIAASHALQPITTAKNGVNDTICDGCSDGQTPRLR